MHMCSYIALVAQVSPCVSFHVIHACAPVFGRLIVSPHPSLYFFLQFFFQLYLMSNPAPDEISMEDPLCDSSLGSMVTLDYVTPLTCTCVFVLECCSLPSHLLFPALLHLPPFHFHGELQRLHDPQHPVQLR